MHRFILALRITAVATIGIKEPVGVLTGDDMREIASVGIVMQSIVAKHYTIRLKPTGEHPRNAASVMKKARRDDNRRSWVRIVNHLFITVIPHLPINQDVMPIRGRECAFHSLEGVMVISSGTLTFPHLSLEKSMTGLTLPLITSVTRMPVFSSS
tara:strand:+ start:4880 stop:5344 length:465 start_codon:yes stop_codon:yes gene_type:complete